MSKALPIRPGTRQPKHRLYLVEDHPVTREGLSQLINYQTDLEVCGQEGRAGQAATEIAALKPDLVIVDISLAGTSGIELIKDLVRRDAGLRILVLSTHAESLYAERSLRAGARGYVMKHQPTEHVMTAIRQVLSGRVYLGERMQNRLLSKMVGSAPAALASDIVQLSDRELEVFELIGEGWSTRQIGASLHLSVSTVETYRAHLKQKLRLENATELVQHAVEWVHSRDF